MIQNGTNPLIAYNDMYSGYSFASPGDSKREAEISYEHAPPITRIIDTQRLLCYTIERKRDELRKIDESVRAFFGDSWPTEVKQDRRAHGLPIVDINMFRMSVESVVGLERQNRRENRLLPAERSDEFDADVLNLALKYTSRTNNESFYETEVMTRMGLVTGRSHREWVIDYSNDVFGEMKQIMRSPAEVLLDPDFTDYNTLEGDCKFRFHILWVTPRELRRRYNFKNVDWAGLEYTPARAIRPTSEVQVAGIDDRYIFPSYQSPEVFWDKQYVRLIRCWKYDYKTAYRAVNLNAESADQVLIGETFDVAHIDGFKNKLKGMGYDLSTIMIKPVQKRYCSYHVISGNLELEWKPDIGQFWPWNDFFATNVDGRIAGVWDVVRDRQMWINFAGAKLLQRFGQVGQQPFFIEEDSFVDDINLAQAFRDGQPIVMKKGSMTQGAMPFHVERDHSLQSIDPILRYIESMQSDLKIASGVGDVQSGRAPGSVTAASALAILQAEGLRAISSYSANMSMTRSLNNQLKLYMMGQLFRQQPKLTLFKLQRVVGQELSLSQDVDMRKGVATQLANGRSLEQVLANLPTARYDVQEDNDSGNIMLRAQKLQDLIFLRNIGAVIPPEMGVDLVTSFSGREKDRLRKAIERTEAAKSQMMGSADQANVMKSMGMLGGKGGENPLADAGFLNNEPGMSVNENRSLVNPTGPTYGT